jgi:hypothetical protein
MGRTSRPKSTDDLKVGLLQNPLLLEQACSVTAENLKHFKKNTEKKEQNKKTKRSYNGIFGVLFTDAVCVGPWESETHTNMDNGACSSCKILDHTMQGLGW